MCDIASPAISLCISFKNWVGPSLKKHVFDFAKNVEDFKRKKEKLAAVWMTYEEELEKARTNRQEPAILVKIWSKKYEQIRSSSDKVEQGLRVNEKRSRCSFKRFNFSKQLMEKIREMNDYIDEYFQLGSLLFVDQPPPTTIKQTTDYVPNLNSIESNKKTVYAAITEFSVIGLWGMGGVGKTTLMKKINNEMHKGSDFKHVVMVTISSNPDIEKIQDTIGGRLQSNWNHSRDTHDKASMILDYLKQNDNTLIIFDDVWETLDLEAIGITDGDDERKYHCKIVLTTRSKEVCMKMDAKAIKMRELPKNESWKLFKTNADINDNVDPEIKELAEKVCKKCAGLPLAISVVAKSLKGEYAPSMWRQTLKFLQEGDPEGVPDFLENVYSLLKLSYDRLPRDDLKKGFLLCSLFPEDGKIKLSDLIWYGIGAGIIAKKCQGKGTDDAYRNIFIQLKRSGLLQDVAEEFEENQKENSARMHDVVRDLAIYIAEKEFKGFFNQTGLKDWISSMEIGNDQLTNIEEMKFISLNGNKRLNKFHPNSFDRMENVLLMDLRESSMKELTLTGIQKLKNLRALMFRNISVNVKDLFCLHNLSVLCLQNVHIMELNQQFCKKLVNLRVIDFSGTTIDFIRPKAFSTLQNKLEVLHMSGSFRKWQAFNQEDGDCVAFVELTYLMNLYSLRINIDDERIFSNEHTPGFVFPSVEDFSITKSKSSQLRRKAPILESSHLLNLPDIQLNNAAKWLQNLFEKTKVMNISRDSMLKNDVTQVVDAVFEQDCMKVMRNLENLQLYHSPKYKSIIQYSSSNTHDNHNLNTTSIPILAYGSFQRLKDIVIYGCNGLKFLFSWNVVVCFVQLNRLYIHDCSQLEVIIGRAETDKDQLGTVCYSKKAQILFPKLKKIALHRLPNLESLWQQQIEERIEMEWSSLQNLWVLGCGKLKRLFLGEKSAPMIERFDCSKEWYNKLQWEDEQAASRFQSICTFC